MNEYPNGMKEKLTFTINETAASSSLFVKNSGKDFTHNRKLPIKSVIQRLLSMGENSIYKELLEAQG